MTRHHTAPVALLAAIFSLLVVSEAYAQRNTSLDEGPIVRRKLLFRSSRFEAGVRLGASVGDSYKRNLLAGLDLNYYLTNEFGLGVTASYGALQLDTDLLEQINASGSGGDDISYASTMMLFDAHLSYVPIYGKFSILKSTIINYDIHLIGGFGGALIQSEGPGDKLAGFKPAPVFGGGVRIFLSDSIALVVDVRDYLYSAADLQEGDADPVTEFRNNVVTNLGVSFFFPGEVKVSR